ncbi:MAG: uroporphyrinogen-III synthase [Pirellulaceae bacterium]|nr:uroporphyrinogen-III synthase [Pirellulaceae bacterium]
MVTRPGDQGSELAQLCQQKGWEAVQTPLLTIEPAYLNTEPLSENQRQKILQSQWLLFTSRQSAKIFVNLLQRNELELQPGHKIGAVGNETAGELRRGGCLVDLVPAEENGAQSGAGLAKKLLEKRVRSATFFCGETTRGDLEKELLSANVDLFKIVLYRALPIHTIPLPVQELCQNKSNIYLPLTSPKMAQVGAKLFAPWIANWKVITISPTTSKTVEELGLSIAAEAKRPSNEGLIEAIDEIYL